MSTEKAEVCPTSPTRTHTQYPYPVCTGGVPTTPTPYLYLVPLCVRVYAHARIPTYTDIAQAIYAPTCVYSPTAEAGGYIRWGIIMHYNTLGEIQHIGLHYNANSATYARDKEH